MTEPAPKPRFASFRRENRGPRILAITGAILLSLTLLGAILHHAWPQALWTQVLFSVAIAGLVGFATNWVAIKMLFHPRVRFMGVQGVVPRRRVELAGSVAATMEEHLISADRMHRLLVDSGAVTGTLETLAKRLPAMLEDPHARAAAQNEVRRGIQTGIESITGEVRDTLKKKLRGNITALIGGATAGMTLGPLAGILAAGASKSGMLDPLVDKLMADMLEELDKNGGLDKAAAQIVSDLPRAATDVLADKGVRERLTEMVFEASEELIKAIDVKKMVEQELLAHDDRELEELIDAVASNELVFIQVAGGGIGMVAGLALVWPILLAPMAVVFGTMWWLGRRAEARVTAAPKPSTPEQTAAPAGTSASAMPMVTAQQGASSPDTPTIIEAEFVAIAVTSTDGRTEEALAAKTVVKTGKPMAADVAEEATVEEPADNKLG